MKVKTFLLIILAMFASLIPATHIKAEPNPFLHEELANPQEEVELTEYFNMFERSYRYYYEEMLNEEERQIYLGLVEHFKIKQYSDYANDFVYTITVDESLTGQARFDFATEAFKKAFRAFEMDYKEVFWLNSAWYMNLSAIGQDVTINVSFVYNSEEGTPVFSSGILNVYIDNEALFKNDFKALIQRVKNLKLILDEIPSDYEKIKKAHDILVLSNDYTLTKGELLDERQHSPVGALIETTPKATVCEAYAEAFQMLMGLYGIRSVYGIGVAENSRNEKENHAWNYVEINDIWYMVDVTWDDPITKPYDPLFLSHDFFMVPIPRSHFPNTELEEGNVVELSYPLPSPIATSKLNPDTLANFIIESEEQYLYTGSPISGYESITLEDDLGSFNVTYYKDDGTSLDGPPTEIGSYYFIVRTNDDAPNPGKKQVFFEIVPKMFQVKFYDKDNNLIKEEQVAQGKQATPPEYKVPGYNLDGWDKDFSNVQSDLEIRPILSKIVAKFYDREGNLTSIDLETVSVSKIISTKYPGEIGENEFFAGWLQNGNLIVPGYEIAENLELIPAIYSLDVKLDKAKLDGNVYKARKSIYENEKFIFESENIMAIKIERSEIGENGIYTMNVTVGSKGTTETKVLSFTVQTYDVMILGMGFKKGTLIAIAGGILAVILLISIVPAVFKKRR